MSVLTVVAPKWLFLYIGGPFYNSPTSWGLYPGP